MALRLLLGRADTSASESERVVVHKRMFKVISPITRREGGGTYWMRLGTAFTNKDDSINIYLDAVPRDLTFQLRELDEREMKPRVEVKPPLTLPTAAKPDPAADVSSGVPF